MKKNSKIYVAGHRGLAGSAILRKLQQEDYQNLITASSQDLDLIIQNHVEHFFSKEKPEYVFLSAAKVGGIHANATFPADFIYRNLMIQSNVIQAAYKYGVKRLIFLGSSCIYPRECPQPMQEQHLLSGPLEWTNRPYAVAKIAGIEMCWSYNRQYATQFLCLMPTNLYGPSDNYDLSTSHVLPALIRKMHEAKMSNSPHVTVWGSGKPLREFLHSDDLAQAAYFLMTHQLDGDKNPPIFNVGSGEEISIKELAQLIADVVGFRGELLWDQSKPDGTLRKLLDSSRLKNIGWKHSISLREGIESTYRAYAIDKI